MIHERSLEVAASSLVVLRFLFGESAGADLEKLLLRFTVGRNVRAEPLTGKTRLEEVARMLGGLKITHKTRAAAAELLREARAA